MGSSLAGRPEKRSWARLWMKKLNLVAMLPRLDSISLPRRGRERGRERGGESMGGSSPVGIKPLTLAVLMPCSDQLS